MENQLNLAGKKIIITGGSSGLGRETATLLNQLGAFTILIARNEENLKSVCSCMDKNSFAYYSYDLRDINGIESLIGKIIGNHGKLDGLVHCAGIGTMRPLGSTTYDFLHDMMLINFYSFIELVRIYAKRNNNNGGSIVALSSVASLRGDKCKTAYSASKSAIDGAIRVMALELCSKKIRVNSVAAGFIKTDMYELYLSQAGDKALQNVISKQVMGIGEPIDVANAVAYLISDLSKFITGTALVVDGGYMAQ